MRTKVACFFVFSLMLSACRKDQLNDCFQKTGRDITSVRAVGHFSKIKIGENFDILLVQDTALDEQVKITGGSNIVGQIITKVKNNTLSIENKNTCNFVRSYNRKISIEIRVRFLDDIEIYAASNLRSDDTLNFLKTDFLELKNYGLGDIHLKLLQGFLTVRTINSGNVTLEGRSYILSCSVEEATSFNAEKLLCDDVYIDTHTPLDCRVNARNQLFAKIFYKGNVYYRQEPTKVKELVVKKGSGMLIPGF